MTTRTFGALLAAVLDIDLSVPGERILTSGLLFPVLQDAPNADWIAGIISPVADAKPCK